VNCVPSLNPRPESRNDHETTTTVTEFTVRLIVVTAYSDETRQIYFASVSESAIRYARQFGVVRKLEPGINKYVLDLYDFEGAPVRTLAIHLSFYDGTLTDQDGVPES